MEALRVSPDNFLELVEELRFRYHKWDAYVGGRLRILPKALLLDAAEHEEAVACCVAVHAALERAVARLLDEPAHLERLCIPNGLWPILRAEQPHPSHIARYDLIPTAAGWMLPEVNEDAPGGFNECLAAPHLFHPLLASGRAHEEFARHLMDALPQGRRVGLVYATGYAEDLEQMRILAELLASHGREVVLASPAHLSCGPFGKPRLQGTPLDWILRFFPGEWYGHLPNLRAWERAVARVPVVNPLTRIIAQSKGLFALWREVDLLPAQEVQLLNRHTPHTVFFDASELEAYRAEREAWVLKKQFGRMGDSVSIGRLCKPEEWDKALAEAAKTPAEYIVQRAFSPLAVPNGATRLYPALGVYLINGQFAGHYSRADELGFTTHEAYYVVTAVETV